MNRLIPWLPERTRDPERRGPIRPTTDTTTPPTPALPVDACRHCDHPGEGHEVRYAAVAGWHPYESPTPARVRRAHEETPQ